MQLKPEEISKIIRAQIKHYENAIEQSETGTVIMVGDGMRCSFNWVKMKKCVCAAGLTVLILMRRMTKFM